MMQARSFRQVALALLTAMTLAACGSEVDSGNEAGTETATAPPDLEGSTWDLVDLTALGGYQFTPPDSNDYSVSFRSDNRLTGRSDCNTLSGSWFAEPTLHFENFGSTRSLCLSGSLHNQFVLYLRDVNDYQMEGENLVLRTPTEEVRLTFAPSP